MYTRNDEKKKSTTISVCLKVVTLMWHMVYMYERKRMMVVMMMMGEKGRTRRKKANVYIQKVHASCYFLFSSYCNCIYLFRSICYSLSQLLLTLRIFSIKRKCLI